MAGGFGSFLAHSQLVTFIRDIHFPCSKDDLISAAEDGNAPQQVLDQLHKLPEKEYQSLADVTETLAKEKI